MKKHSGAGLKRIDGWRLFATGGALTLGLTAPGLAGAQAPEPRSGSTSSGSMAPGEDVGEVVHLSATVASIDRGTRTVQLRTNDGEKVPVQVPADMKGFDKLKVGDKIDLDYYEAIAVSLLPPGAKPSISERSMKGREMGAGMVGREITAAAEIVSVDAAKNKLTFKAPGGESKTVTVSDPDLRKRLPSLKPGQVIQVTYTEAVAVAIRPPSAK